MASNARCLPFNFFLLVLIFLVVSLSHETQARESKFFSKLFHQHLSRKTQENLGSINLSPAVSPSLAPVPSPEPEPVEEHGHGLYGRQPSTSTNVVGQVKHVEADTFPKKTFRDFVMSYPNENENGWNGRENGNGHEHETEKHRKGEKQYLVHGKYYYGYVTGENGKENEKQGVSEYVEDENKGNVNEYESEKQGVSEYVEDENKGNVNEYENEKQGMGEKKYYVNGKYYTGYVTKSENGMNEYVEDEDENSFPLGKGNGNEYEQEHEYGHEKQGNKYLVNGKYYDGYITGQNGNQNEMQGHRQNGNQNEMQGHSNQYETEKQEMGENKYLVNGKYYSGYVTKAENGNQNDNERQEMSEYMEEEKGFPESEDKGNEYEYESEKQDMAGNKQYLVNGKYYSGYVTKSNTGNGNEKLGMNEEYVDENEFQKVKGKENDLYDTEEQQLGQGEKKYFVNGKYYSGYVTGESRGLNNQDYSRHEEQEYMP